MEEGEVTDTSDEDFVLEEEEEEDEESVDAEEEEEEEEEEEGDDYVGGCKATVRPMAFETKEEHS